ncbi:M23 family metallopeptidase [Bacillus massilinigeriensis]|uniref:M23 family metallopeptidase n=1 Tax=Bacillus mediterraneensis TaxID=1805474 RepID=UPI0008F96017|nr:M23 family metallopeptidase [Bacillus mediterraneensis]
MREEEKKSSQDTSVKRFLKKRWAYPAIYLASAAIILSGVVWYQNSGTKSDKFDYEATDVPGKKGKEAPAIEVNKALENFMMPISDPEKAVITTKFYDNDSKKEEQEAALVVYNNQYHPNNGIDIALKNGKEFVVVASVSGTVKSVKEDAFLGNVIEIEHDKGIVTQYQSVKNIKVKAGDEVDQGQALATAGRSMFNEKAGTHVHFEIRKDGVAVNPEEFFQKPMTALQETSVKPAENSGKDSKTEEGTGEGTNAGEGNSSGESGDDAKTGEGATPGEGSKDDAKSGDDRKPGDETKQENDMKKEDSTKKEQKSQDSKLEDKSKPEEGSGSLKEENKPSSDSKQSINS